MYSSNEMDETRYKLGISKCGYLELFVGIKTVAALQTLSQPSFTTESGTNQ